jgi:hypothetical protein
MLMYGEMVRSSVEGVYGSSLAFGCRMKNKYRGSKRMYRVIQPIL